MVRERFLARLCLWREGTNNLNILSKAILLAGSTFLTPSHEAIPNLFPTQKSAYAQALSRADNAPLPLTLPPSAINTEKDPTKILEITRQISSDTINLLKENLVESLGFRISNAWVGTDGFKYLAYQGGIIQADSSGKIFLWNLLDQCNIYGLDTQLNNGSLGVTVPPHIDYLDSGNPALVHTERIKVNEIPKDIEDFDTNIRKNFETGVFTSPGKDYGPYTVYRKQRIAYQKWTDGENKGLIQRILVGDAAKQAGLIPQEVLLERPDLGSGGKIEPGLLITQLREIGDLKNNNLLIRNLGNHFIVLTDYEYISKKAKEKNIKLELILYDNYSQVPIIENNKNPDHAYYDLKALHIKDNLGGPTGVYTYGRESVFILPNRVWQFHIGLTDQFKSFYSEENSQIISTELSKRLAFYTEFNSMPYHWPKIQGSDGLYKDVLPKEDLIAFYSPNPLFRILQFS